MPSFTIGVPGDDWKQLQRELGAHALQCRAWGQFQADLGRHIVYASDEKWSWMGVVMPTRPKHLFVPMGPTAKTPSALDKAIDSILEAGQKLGVAYVRIEPVAVGIPAVRLERHGFSKMGAIHPEHPWRLDISRPEEELRKGLSSGHRNAINGAERRGITFRRADEEGLDDFLRLIHGTGAKRGFRAHPDSYYRQMMRSLAPLGGGALYVAEHEGEAVAASIVLDSATTRYYAHAGASDLGRKLQAPAPLVWHMLLEAKAEGMRTFDFWGVAPTDDPSHPWAGFSRFKRSFGGDVFPQLGCWEMPLKPRLLKMTQMIKRVLR